MKCSQKRRNVNKRQEAYIQFGCTLLVFMIRLTAYSSPISRSIPVVTKADGQQEEIYEIFFHNGALKNEFGIPLFDVILDTVF